MVDTLQAPIRLEVAPLAGQERKDVITEAQSLLSGKKFNPIYFSRVIGYVASLLGGSRDVNGSRIVTPPLFDSENGRALVIWHYPESTNSLIVEPSWTTLPPEEQAAARGQEPYTTDQTRISYRYSSGFVPEKGYVCPTDEESSILELSSMLWFPINMVDRTNYLGGYHWTDQDGDVNNGWAGREKTYFLNPESQRLLARRVFDVWQATDPIANGQQILPI